MTTQPPVQINPAAEITALAIETQWLRQRIFLLEHQKLELQQVAADQHRELARLAKVIEGHAAGAAAIKTGE